MTSALLLYTCATGERSSRRIERRCEDDVELAKITKVLERAEAIIAMLATQLALSPMQRAAAARW